MNFLQLCQFAHRYIGGGNEVPGTAPLSVVNQNGHLFALVRSVQDAYLDVLNDQTSWTFMQRTGRAPLPVGASKITPQQIRQALPDYGSLVTLIGDGVRYIDVRPSASRQDPFIGNQSSGPSSCVYVPYQQWRGAMDRDSPSSGTPTMFTIHPDESLLFNSKATSQTFLEFDYRIIPPALTNNNDTPIFGPEHHSVIAWRAVLLWGGSNEDGNKAAFALSEYNRILNDMRSRYLPETVFSIGQLYNSPATTS